MLPNFSYVRPSTVGEAAKALAEPGSKAHAGGTDLLGCLRDRVFAADRIVSLSGLQELRGIGVSADGSLRIGAMTTIADVAAHRAIAERFAALGQAAAGVASPQLRNQGTVGGNICQRPRCWYFRGQFSCARKGGDTCYAMQGENQYHAIFGGSTCLAVHPSDLATALVALDAKVTIAGRVRSRTVPLEQFFLLAEDDLARENILEPGEIVTDVLVPAPAAGMRSAYRKARMRGSWDFAIASVAVSLTEKQGRVDTARVVLGAAALKPWRAIDAERMLAGAKLDAKTIALAASAAVKGATPLEQNEYKIPMFRGLVTEVLETF